LDHSTDEFDRAILRLLQLDAGLPQREIAERVNLSAPTVQRRIARMEKAGIIQRMVAVVDPGIMGFAITVIVEVTLVNDRSKTVANAKKLFASAPEVQQCYCVVGAAAFFLVLVVPSMEGYEQRTARLFGDNENIRSYRTMVVVDRVKATMDVPI